MYKSCVSCCCCSSSSSHHQHYHRLLSSHRPHSSSSLRKPVTQSSSAPLPSHHQPQCPLTISPSVHSSSTSLPTHREFSRLVITKAILDHEPSWSGLLQQQSLIVAIAQGPCGLGRYNLGRPSLGDSLFTLLRWVQSHSNDPTGLQCSATLVLWCCTASVGYS